MNEHLASNPVNHGTPQLAKGQEAVTIKTITATNESTLSTSKLTQVLRVVLILHPIITMEVNTLYPNSKSVL